MAGAGLTGGSIVVTAVFVAAVTMPRWGAGSIWRHRLWRLRDALADDIIRGRLPGRHPAVSGLLYDITRQVEHPQPRSLITAIAFEQLAIRRFPSEVIRGIDREAPMDDLSPALQEKVRRYRRAAAALSGAALITSSWLGCLMLLTTLVARAPRRLWAAAERMNQWRIGKRAARSARRFCELRHA